MFDVSFGTIRKVAYSRFAKFGCVDRVEHRSSPPAELQSLIVSKLA